MHAIGMFVVCACLMSACNVDPRLGLDAGGSPIDGGITDASIPDRFVPDAYVGAALLEACSSDAQCEIGLRCATEFPRAFCTRDCAREFDCIAAGAHCVDGRCLPGCRSGARDCDRFGGACLAGGPAFCVPSCGATGITTTNCPSELSCDPYRGTCTTTASSGTDIGGPCVEDADCRSGLCFAELDGTGSPTGVVGGYCLGGTRYGGPSADGSLQQGGCPIGSVILDTGDIPIGDWALCVHACDGPDDCRTGYFCGAPSGATSGYCAPINCDTVGDDMCPRGTACQSIDGDRRCLPCEPVCADRSCGSDGCGGSCGTCSGFTRCTEAGACECVPETDLELCAAASALCGSITATDRCGMARTVASCGGCTSPQTCGALAANRCGCVAQSDVEICRARGATCGTVSAIDRCGVSRSVHCGTCTLPQTCGGAGVPNTCGVCTPSCTGRSCGSDGCGGSCGGCSVGERCSTSYRCEPVPCDPVRNTGCTTGTKCDWTGSRTECVTAGAGSVGSGCFDTTSCAAELTCSSEDVCREYCATNADCRAGVCAFSLNGTPYRLCSRSCNPVTGSGGSGCNPGEGCRLFNATNASEVTDCGAYGTGFEGDWCSDVSDCYSGNTCVASSCRRVCRLGTSCTFGACQTVSGWRTYGVCPLSS